jgi:septal ring-binding cell division protein DamX
MSQKASQPKKKASAKESRFALQLTRVQLFLWLGFAFVAMIWMFALGVLVGRGLSPVRFDVPKLKKELMALKQEALERDQARFNVETENLSGNPDLDFYKTLTDKKEEARLKFVKAHEQTAKPYVKYSEVFKPKKTGGPRVFTIQVASLKSATEAGQEVARLKRKGYDAYEVTVNVPGKGAYHRVRVGHFADQREADLVAARLKEDKLKTMIVRE